MPYGTLNVDKIVNDNGVTFAGLYGFKNRIINGDMRIDQRNAGASLTANNTVYAVDRFRTYMSQSSKGTIQQNAGAVTPPTGFSNYLGFTSTSAYSVLSTDHFVLTQYIEGFNTADFGFGTAAASTVTLSFWVRSSLTGTFGGSLENSAFNRSYPFTYTISAANTWEQKSVTIAGDTTGTWVGSTNGIGLRVNFGMGVGSTLSGTAGAWAGSDFQSATGAVSVVGTNGATFYITGVQLEKGSTATSFDYRPYGTELMLCQRYCIAYRDTGNSMPFATGVMFTTNRFLGSLHFPVVMRASPTATFSAAATFAVITTTLISVSSLGQNGVSTYGSQIDATTSTATAGDGAYIRGNAAGNSIVYEAEL